MTLLFVLGIALALVFSFSVACYFIFFKTNIGSNLAKGAMTLVLGLVVFVLTFAVCVILVWPPYVWSIIK